MHIDSCKPASDYPGIDVGWGAESKTIIKLLLYDVLIAVRQGKPSLERQWPIDNYRTPEHEGNKGSQPRKGFPSGDLPSLSADVKIEATTRRSKCNEDLDLQGSERLRSGSPDAQGLPTDNHGIRNDLHAY